MNTLPFPYIDFHNHSMWNGGDTIEVVSIHGAQQKECRYFTIGHHPWWAVDVLPIDSLALMESAYMEDKRCLGLGEFGLDSLKGVALDIQEEIFIQQITLANALNAPVVIHCVRAFDRMLRLRKRYGRTPWVVHGFVRNKILAGQILDAGMSLSVAPHSRMTPVFVEMLQFLPIDAVFLETDSDFSMNIIDRYAIFATLKGMDVDLLKAQMYHNFTKFYKEKWKYHVG